ncbi:MAG: selenide, water dikinase SelD [Leptospiraceae bacterium]|nr:selenide, water dikinase SelD [Leptospiraceae bacterium]
MNTPRLTEFSPGAGCGCKISPQVLDSILKSNQLPLDNPRLLVGNHTCDDAAVYDSGDGNAMISTTDFFTPIVDDPFTFGRIAAVNAISDVYAMGGRPLMAIAILGWPLDRLDAAVARQVVEGGRQACSEAGISIAGGHSIDISDPVFGLAVSGTVPLTHLKRNDTAEAGCLLFLTKPIGVGIITTAEKRRIVREQDRDLAIRLMCRLNSVGAHFGALAAVRAMTDVTGFGLLGHLLEMCAGSGLCARLRFNDIPFLDGLSEYVRQDCFPGGAKRNWQSYGHQVTFTSGGQAQNEVGESAVTIAAARNMLADPQTSGGLLVAVQPQGVDQFLHTAAENGYELQPFGELEALPESSPTTLIEVQL